MLDKVTAKGCVRWHLHRWCRVKCSPRPYNDVCLRNADPYVGGLAEPSQGSAHIGPLFAASITEQFARLRDADWWYFENGANNKLYNETEINEIRGTSKFSALCLCGTGAFECCHNCGRAAAAATAHACGTCGPWCI